MEHIRTLRIERGMSLCNFGVLVEVQAVSLVRLESGKYDLRLSTLRKLTQVLEVSVRDLIDQPQIGVIAPFADMSFIVRSSLYPHMDGLFLKVEGFGDPWFYLPLSK